MPGIDHSSRGMMEPYRYGSKLQCKGWNGGFFKGQGRTYRLPVRPV